MYDLTGFQRDLLYVAAGLTEPHGLAIKDELEEYYEKEIHHGRLYPNLDTLVDKGLLEKGEADRRTNVYSVTRRGRREIEARREWEAQYVSDLLGGGDLEPEGEAGSDEAEESDEGEEGDEDGGGGDGE